MAQRCLLLQWYARYLTDRDLVDFLSHVAANYTIPTLCRLMANGGIHTRRAATLSLGWLGDSTVEAPLGRALRDPDRGVRLLAMTLLPEVWARAAGESVQHALLQIRRWNLTGQFATAESAASELLRQLPDLDEAEWQWCIAKVGHGNDTAAIRGLRRILLRNRNFFPAAMELGRALARQKKSADAIGILRIALKICPELESARMQLRQLERERRR